MVVPRFIYFSFHPAGDGVEEGVRDANAPCCWHWRERAVALLYPSLAHRGGQGRLMRLGKACPKVGCPQWRCFVVWGENDDERIASCTAKLEPFVKACKDDKVESFRMAFLCSILFTVHSAGCTVSPMVYTCCKHGGAALDLCLDVVKQNASLLPWQPTLLGGCQ